MKVKEFRVLIKKGKHSLRFRDRIKLWNYCLGASLVNVEIKFDDPRYDYKGFNIPEKDKEDWMKGFGTSKHILPTIRKVSSINYKPLWYKRIPFGYCWVGAQHRDSVRLVFRHRYKEDVLEVARTYIYRDCQRILPRPEHVITIPAENKTTNSHVLFSEGYFNLHPYFGGNQKSPIDMWMTVKIQKL